MAENWHNSEFTQIGVQLSPYSLRMGKLPNFIIAPFILSCWRISAFPVRKWLTFGIILHGSDLRICGLRALWFDFSSSLCGPLFAVFLVNCIFYCSIEIFDFLKHFLYCNKTARGIREEEKIKSKYARRNYVQKWIR